MRPDVVPKVELDTGILNLEVAMKAMWALLWVLGVSAVAVASDDKSPDQAFYEDAWQANLAEVQQGQVAQTKGQSPAVKEFAAMMVKDHTDANANLMTLAAHKGIDLPSTSGVKQEGNKAKLQMLPGDLFDRSYIKGMVRNHRDDIEAFQNEARSGRDPEARSYAVASLPTLREHLKKIESIARDLGVSLD
jgi:putative membrane protein